MNQAMTALPLPSNCTRIGGLFAPVGGYSVSDVGAVLFGWPTPPAGSDLAMIVSLPSSWCCSHATSALPPLVTSNENDPVSLPFSPSVTAGRHVPSGCRSARNGCVLPAGKASLPPTATHP